MTAQNISGEEKSLGGAEEHATVVFSARSHSGPFAILNDLREGLRHGPVWRAFAWDEIQSRYRRSVLGLAWIAISYLFFVIVIVLFFRGFASKGSNYYINYVVVGFAAFTFLRSCIADGCRVFTSSSTWIKSASLPYSVYVFKGLSRVFFTFIIHLIFGTFIMLWFGWRPSWSALFAIPALIAFLFNAIWVQYLFGLVAARWQDFQHLIGTLSRMLFFATPILWIYPDTSGLRRTVADFNPMTHFIDVFRAPLIGEPLIEMSWWVVFGWTIVGWTVTLFVGGYMRRRLPFWV